MNVDPDGIEALEGLRRRLTHTLTIARLCGDALKGDASEALHGVGNAIEDLDETLGNIIRAQRH